MQTDLLQIRIPHDMKIQAEAIFSEIGLKTGDAVRVFFQQCINNNGLPFALQAKTPNQETIQAMQETDRGQTQKISLAELRQEMGLKVK